MLKVWKKLLFTADFIKRNEFSCRKVTSIEQEDNRSPNDIKATVDSYFETLNDKISAFPNAIIYNVDETPVYIDMMQTRTISFKEGKNGSTFNWSSKD